MRALTALRTTLAVLAVAAAPSLAPAQEPAARTLITNVDVFDGTGDTLLEDAAVLIEGNRIAAVSTDPITADGATVIDGGGRVLMPGLIDAHWHTMLIRPTPMQALASDVGLLNLLAAVEAEATLLRGFTTVRDLGGPSFSLKTAIDRGLIAGPRIYPSGAMITVTGGHGDFRLLTELPRAVGGPPSRMEEVGGSALADSPDEVRLRTREQLMQGASQIKLTAGGGVSSPHSPLDIATFTLVELRAAVEAAENWGTYVCVHAYTPDAIRIAIEAGVRCIEHGHLMDEDTARVIADSGTWLSTQPFLSAGAGGGASLGDENARKKAQVVAGTDRVYTLARQFGIRTAFGTDILFSAEEATQQGARLAAMARWYTPAEALRMATSENAALLALSGPRNPYPDGPLGVIAEGAYADLILVDGNPLEDLSLVADPGANFDLIMKDGVIVKTAMED